MSETENVKAVLEAAASHPKVATTVSAVTTSMGLASFMSDVQTLLGAVSLAIGCVVGIYVVRIHRIKEKIYQRMLDDGESLKD